MTEQHEDNLDHPFDTLLVCVEGAMATVRLHRPENRNAMSRKMMRELTEIARALKERTDIQAVILAGAPDYFSAGADLADPDRHPARPQSLLEQRQAVLAGPDMCKAWEVLEQVTIMAIEGYCIGGAVALALACDFRLIGESGSLRLPEVPLGLNMSWQSLPRLTALVGPARAKRFTIFGERLGASDALGWGLVDAVVADGETEGLARAWAAKVATLPPLPVRMSKEAINAAAHALNQATAFMDRDQFLLTSGSRDFQEGATAFFEKRDPVFKGD